MTNEKTEKLFAEIQKGKEQIKELKKEIAIKVKDNFHDIAKELFQLYPELKSFGWNQYTPYFNDGEPCYFSANIEYPTINGFDEYDDSEDSDDIVNIYREIESNPTYEKIVNSVKEFLERFDEEDYQNIFDDHVEVTVTADKVETNDFEHE